MYKDYVAFDLETTGLSCDTDEIIEIGALKVKDGKLCDRFNTLIHPKKPISPKITEITGISNEMVKDAPEISEAISAFVEFCGDDIVIGHNVMFDYRFTKVFAKRYGCSFEKFGIDTLKIARTVHADLPSKSLESMCKHYDIVNAAAHRAYHDALATAKIYQIMAHYYEESFPEIFKPVKLEFKVKKIQAMTAKQKDYLLELVKYHKIDFSGNLEEMTKSEASRTIDRIILQYGRMT